MKKFLKKILFLVVLPAVILMFAEALLPPTTFTYRNWEGLYFHTGVPTIAAWYQGYTSFMREPGDLCHHTDKAVFKDVTWKNDELGFRNDSFCRQPDILLIGDSFIAGCSLSQEEMLHSQISLALKDTVSVYNMAPWSLSGFDNLLLAGLIEKPRLLVFSIVERDLPEPLQKHEKSAFSDIKMAVKKAFRTGNINVYIDKALRRHSVSWLRARILGSSGKGVPGTDTEMYFFQGAVVEGDDNKIESVVKVVSDYKNYCDSLGIDFIFLPMPDKETVYFDKVPLETQPHYLLRLDSLLSEKNIRTINTLQIYNDFRKSSETLLYHNDDTHWNINATRLIAAEIAEEYKKGFFSSSEKSEN